VSRVLVGFKTSPQAVDWSTLDETWAAAGELDALDSGWMNDHLSDPSVERGGSSWEPLTLIAALARRVPGKWVGHGVLSNTFRHPAMLAKQATALDHITGGRFIVGLGAGWHEGEHRAFGIPLPPIGERISRLESAVRVLRALGSQAAGHEPGVTLDDPAYPLRGATNLPAPLTPGGPSIWLGGQGPRGFRIAASLADGWILPAGPDEGLVVFRDRRGAILRELDAIGRDPATFTFAAQLPTGTTPAERRASLASAIEFARAGAGHVILGIPASSGPLGLRSMVHQVAEPLRESVGRA
jgi:alkanesulfonate monooxygenase SsuD/methylene tetrahydromethanopterin reductase-like flavin-dependent oxidoreductase (luciferase family)